MQHASEQLHGRTETEVRALRRCLNLAVAALIVAIGISMIGALVGATGATDSCNGWPLCDGQLSPTGNPENTLVVGHRFGSFAIILLTAGLVCISRIRLERYTGILTATSAAFALVLFQSVVGGAAVVRELPGMLTGIHLLLSFVVAGALVATIVAIRQELSASASQLTVDALATGYLRAAVALAPVVVLLASRVDSASLSGLTAGNPGGGLAALIVTGGTLVVLLIALLLQRHASRLTRIVLFSSVTVLLLAAVAAGISASVDVPALVPAGALALATAGWVGLVAIATGTAVTGNTTPAAIPSITRVRELARDFFKVMKPGIMVLLLVTTLGAMLVASQGWPPLSLALLTLLGGVFASGGASALNCYHDRDIDGVMARTRKRPIPTGGLTPDQVRAWGYILTVASVLLLAVWVNPLAASMALAGNIFYVEIYTRRLKRSTPQNIVIGGAAGSFPPLVGWAAASGSLGLGAFLIAALVFYWTPPHFWSLALLKANDYRRAGIPMLPVTHGEHETRRRIVLYTLLLVPITLLMVPAGVAGWMYGVVAALLGARFIWVACKMFREDTSRLAWPLFKYSNYYLAALLAAMVLDNVLRQLL